MTQITIALLILSVLRCTHRNSKHTGATMYNIFYTSSDAAECPLYKATLPTMEAAREMHSKLLEAGWEVLTEWPH